MEQVICDSCMKQRPSQGACPHCGFDGSGQNEPHQLPVGTVLQENYVIGRVLGQGGFGITYIGWDRLLSTPVAIKEYFPSGMVYRDAHSGTAVNFYQQENHELFEKHKNKMLKEARVLAKLSHIPGVVKIRSFFAQNNTAYIVMEYVDGITLKEHVKRRGKPLEVKECLKIMEPVLDALQAIHDSRLIHRDISPDNIMLLPDGTTKLIDFGTVRNLDPQQLSQSTENVLKPGYAPMEQYHSGGNLGPWTDIYALCGTFYFLLTGQVPPEALSRIDCGDEIEYPQTAGNIPPQIRAALAKGMALRAAQRVQSIAELRKLLSAEEKSVPAGKKRVPLFLGAAVLAAALFGLVLLGPKIRSSGNGPAPNTQTEDAAAGNGSVTDAAPIGADQAMGVSVSFRENITNILLVGRTGGFGTEDQFADAMVLVSVDRGKSQITLTSMLRDAYVVIPEYKGRFNNPNKLSTCYPLGYSLGGTGGAMEMTRQCLQDNFGIDVDYIVEVDFDGFQNAVDLMGGIAVELTAEDAEYLNALPGRWQQVTEGKNHLYGEAALDYVRMCRGGNDIARTEQLRTLLQAGLREFRKQDISTAVGILSQVLTMVRSDMTASQAETLALELLPILNSAQVQTGTCPAEGTYWGTMVEVGGMPYPVIQFDAQRCKQDMAAITADRD